MFGRARKTLLAVPIAACLLVLLVFTDDLAEEQTTTNNVQDYGAVPDDAADDTAAIAAAAADTAPGERLYFPAGTYDNSEQIALNPDVVVHGDHERPGDAEVHYPSVVSGPGFLLNTGNRAHHMTLMATSADQNGFEYGTTTTTDTTVESVQIEGYDSGIYVDRVWEGAAHSRGTVRNSTFKDNVYGFLALRADGFTLSRNTFHAQTRPVEFWGGNSNVVSRNTIDGGIIGVLFLARYGINGASGIFRNNTIKHNEISNVREESISFDVAGNETEMMNTRESDTIAAKPGSPNGGTSFELSSPNWQSTNKSFDDHYMVFSTPGNAQKVFEISSHASHSSVFEVEMPRELYDSVTVGEEVVIGVPAVSNRVTNNHVDISRGTDKTVGIMLYGLGYDNLIQGNTVVGGNLPSEPNDMGNAGIMLVSLMGLNPTGSVVEIPGGRKAPVENNAVRKNVVRNGNIALVLMNYADGGNYVSRGNSVTDNKILNGSLENYAILGSDGRRVEVPYHEAVVSSNTIR